MARPFGSRLAVIDSAVSAAEPHIARERGKICLGGELRIGDAANVWEKLRVIEPAEGRLDIDLSHVSYVDGAIISLLVDLRARLTQRGVKSDILGAPDHARSLVHLYGGDAVPRPPPVPPRRENAIERIGALTERAGRTIERAVTFIGDVTSATRHLVRRPKSLGWGAIAPLSARAGADGIPIVLLLNFLVGFVMAFQSSRQLQVYGANVYVADVVGISVTRELCPLMTAIIMAGRSGASFSAELGTMSVSQEIDALRTMGFSPTPYLVIPRVIALALAAPVLTLLGDVLGVVGGLVVAMTSLGVTAHGYVAELQTAVFASDVWTGLIKSVAFAVSIAFIGCNHGLSTKGSAEGVGRSTTATVVGCLFTIVVVDTLFTVIFRSVGR